MSANSKPCFVLATFFPRAAIWSYFDTIVEAESARPEANRYDADRQYEAMTEAEWLVRQRAFYLRQPLEEIGQDRYDEALNALPPHAYEARDGVLSFNMSERLSGPFTRQFAAHNGRFFTKIVDAGDRSTWITGGEIDREFPTFTSREAERRHRATQTPQRR